MENIRMTVDLFGVPAQVVRQAVKQGFAGSMTDVIRSALIAYGEKYGLLDLEGHLQETVATSLRTAAKERGVSTAEMKKRLKL